MVRILAAAALVWVSGLAAPAVAQTVHEDFQETVRAEVLSIVREYEREVIGTSAFATVQEVEVALLDGARAGAVVSFENDITPLVVGDRIFVNRMVTIDGREFYVFKDFDRRLPLVLLGALFLIAVAAVAGMQGLRAFASLLASITIIMVVLVPALLAGYDPVMMSVGVAGLILAMALFATHGFRAQTLIAFLGTFGAVIATGILAFVSVRVARFTGLADDVAIYLNFSTFGTLDFSGLLLGGILIGILGVLDDIAITQTSVVHELAEANRSLSPQELYRRALRIGRAHIGSLVNTLALAYVGVSLPLILLFAQSDAAWGMLLNQEIVAVELVRTFVGSIGLILAVPLTTLIAVWWIRRFGVYEEAPNGHSHAHEV